MTRLFSWKKYGRYIVTGLVFMYTFKAVDWALESTSMAKRLERANLDALFAGKPIEDSKEIALVTVTDEDYQALFGGVSPLDPAKLREIIGAILDSGPKALGVDFDTSGWKAVEIPQHDATTIVWAAEIDAKSGAVDMGGRFVDSKKFCYGVPSFVPNDDGIIREYSEYAVSGDRAFPALPLNLAGAFLKGPQACLADGPVKDLKSTDAVKPSLINYAGDARAFDRLSAGALLQLKGSPGDAEAATRWSRWKASNLLKDKLVLLGGSYRAARDAYPTPVGYLDGVVILAQTAQTLLPGHKLQSGTPEGLLHSWFSIQGYIILLATFFIPKAWRMGVTLLTGPISAFFGNWIWFYFGGAFVSFVPYLVGLVAHQTFDQIRDFRKLQKENRELKSKLLAAGVTLPQPEAD